MKIGLPKEIKDNEYRVGALAEFERDLIRERSCTSLIAVRSRGKAGARKPMLDTEKRSAVAKTLKDSKDLTTISRTVGVSERTIRWFSNGEYSTS